MHAEEFSTVGVICIDAKLPCSVFGKASGKAPVFLMQRLLWLCVRTDTKEIKKRTQLPMIKKAVFALMLALALTSTAPTANAEVEMPECYPCGSN